MTTITTRQERALSYLEKYELSKQLVNAYGTITFTATFEHEAINQETTSQEFYMDRFQPALTTLIQTLTPLSLVIRDRNKKTAHFEQLSSIDLAQVIEITHEPMSVQELIKEQTTKEFDTESLLPLWRLKVIAETPTTCTIVYVMNHVIGDGMSLTIFFNLFLNELNKNEVLNKEEFKTTVIQVEESNMALPYEKCGPPGISVTKDLVPSFAKEFVFPVFPKSVVRAVNSAGVNGWKGDFPAVEGASHNSEIGLIHVPSDIWKPITLACKQKGISAHSMVAVSMLLAFQHLYPNRSTEFTIPINCRGFCNPPLPNQMGNYVGSNTTYWKAKQLDYYRDNVWDMATKYHHSLQKNKSKAGRQAMLLKFLPNFPASYLDHWYEKRKGSSMGRKGGLELSDLGRFNIEENATWKVKQAYFCQSAHTYNVALGMNSVSVNDNLYCAFDWQKGSLKESKISLYHDTYIGILKAIPLE